MSSKDLSYRKNQPFKVPEGYFDSLEERILKAAASSASKEESLERFESGFTVPDYYFEKLEDRVMERVQEPKQTKVRSLFKRETLYAFAGIAAVLVAIVSTQLLKQPDDLSMQNIDMLALEGYIEESIRLQVPETSPIFEKGDFGFSPYSQSTRLAQEAVIEYLHEHIEEPSLIFDEE